MKGFRKHLAGFALLVFGAVGAQAQATFPFVSDFQTTEGLALWDIFDADADGNTWTPQKSVFGTYDMTYNVGGGTDHNDWLILAPLPFSGGTSYHVSFTMYSLGDNALTFWLLPNNEGGAAVTDPNAAGTEIAVVETPKIYKQVEYEFDFVASECDVPRRFAVQATNDCKASWMYITAITITPTVSTNIAATALTGNPYAVCGHSYTYNARVKNTASSSIDSYSVSLVDEATAMVLATKNVTTTLAAGEEAEVQLSWTPATAGTVQMTCHAMCEGDAFANDNVSPALDIEVLAEGSGERIALGGVASDKTMRHPFDLYNSNAAALNVYPAAEMLGAKGKIKAITVPYANDFKDALDVPVKVYMANTDELAPATWLEQSAMTLVYDGTADFPTTADAAEITLAVPFEYTGSNLAVLTVNTIGYGYYNSVYGYAYTPAEGEGALIWHASGKAFDFTGTPSRDAQRSAMTMVFCDDNETGGGSEVETHFDVSGTVMNADGKYLIDLPITLTPAKEGAEALSTTSLAQGRFAFFNITAGTYRLTINAEAYLSYSVDYELNAEHTDLGTIVLEKDPATYVPQPQPHVATAPRNLRLHTMADGHCWLTWDDDAITDSFEDCTDFIAPDNATAWTCYDMDGFLSWVFDPFNFPGETNPASFIVFNPSATTPSAEHLTTAHSGERFLACVCTEVPGAANDDWFVSPRLNYLCPFTFSFWAQSYRKFIFDSKDLFQVGYSTTGSAPEDFMFVEGVIEAPNDWTQYSYEFPADVRYVCLHCISPFATETELGYMLQIDDVALTPTSTGTPDEKYALQPGEQENSEETVVFYNVYLDGERVAVTTAAQYVFPNSVIAELAEGEHSISVTKCHYFADTNEYLYSDAAMINTNFTGIAPITTEGSCLPVYSLDGRRIALKKFHDGVVISNGQKRIR